MVRVTSRHRDHPDPTEVPADQADTDVPSDSEVPTDADPTGGDPNPDALVLTTVAVPYGDRLTTFDAQGTGIIWHVPAALTARVAAGSLPRREAGESVTAQCVVVDQKRSVLRGLDDDEWSVRPIDENSLPVPPGEYRERLRQLLVAAARRGESVVFAAPGQVEMAPPCVRASVVLDEDGVWLSVVEAFPPFTTDAWADAEVDEYSSRKTAVADEQSMTGAVMLMLMATQSFSPGPEQIGLFFEVSADGPWAD